MNRRILRDFLGALMALALTALTTQTIVHAAPRPHATSLASTPPASTASPARLARRTGCAGAVC
jgi:hypothetical protein